MERCRDSEPNKQSEQQNCKLRNVVLEKNDEDTCTERKQNEEVLEMVEQRAEH